MLNISFSVIISLFLLPSGINGLYCYECLAFECGGSFRECEGAREFVVGELRQYYHLQTSLRRCPAINDIQKWYVMQADVDPCPTRGNYPTCVAGKIKIESSDPSGNKESILVSQATVMGCAKLELSNSIRDPAKKGSCDVIQKNGTSLLKGKKLHHSLVLRHCNDATTICSHQDFCVEHSQSIVQDVRSNYAKSSAPFDYGLALGISLIIVLIFVIIVVIRLIVFSDEVTNFLKSLLPRNR